MEISKIIQNAVTFRKAIDSAIQAGCFTNHVLFGHFPKRSCLLASELFAEYLYKQGMPTIIIQGNGTYAVGTHAWLAIIVEGYATYRDYANKQADEVLKAKHDWSIFEHEQADLGKVDWIYMLRKSLGSQQSLVKLIS